MTEAKIAVGRPMGPDEFVAPQIPPKVWDVWNMLIQTHLTWDRSAKFSVSMAIIALRETGFSDEEIFDCGYLKVENAYVDAGWDVVCTNSADAYFIFTKRKATLLH